MSDEERVKQELDRLHAELEERGFTVRRDDLDAMFAPKPTPRLSCRCEFGWAHDCPHHGNKETR